MKFRNNLTPNGLFPYYLIDEESDLSESSEDEDDQPIYFTAPSSSNEVEFDTVEEDLEHEEIEEEIEEEQEYTEEEDTEDGEEVKTEEIEELETGETKTNDNLVEKQANVNDENTIEEKKDLDEENKRVFEKKSYQKSFVEGKYENTPQNHEFSHDLNEAGPSGVQQNTSAMNYVKDELHLIDSDSMDEEVSPVATNKRYPSPVMSNNKDEINFNYHGRTAPMNIEQRLVNFNTALLLKLKGQRIRRPGGDTLAMHDEDQDTKEYSDISDGVSSDINMDVVEATSNYASWSTYDSRYRGNILPVKNNGENNELDNEAQIHQDVSEGQLDGVDDQSSTSENEEMSMEEDELQFQMD